MHTLLLSIIIPIYKTEQYIGRTLGSICQPGIDHASFEVIAVNDGTPDGAMRIVEDFARRFANIRIINQENQGLSRARNAGLGIARGKYVWFVDSDDWLADDGLARVMEILVDTDADIFGFDMVAIIEKDNGRYRLPVTRFQKLYGRSLTKEDILDKICVYPSQRFVFRQEFLAMHKLRFYPGIIHEDWEFNVKALYFARDIKLVKNFVYCYLKRDTGTIMSTLDLRRSIQSQLLIMKSFRRHCHAHARNNRDRIYWNMYIFHILYGMLFCHGKDWDSTRFKRFVGPDMGFLREAALKGLAACSFLWSGKGTIKALRTMIYLEFLQICQPFSGSED